MSIALEAIGVRSMVNLPINEQGGVVALLYVNDRNVRDWTPDEISLIRDVAERTRHRSERRRAEMALGRNSRNRSNGRLPNARRTRPGLAQFPGHSLDHGRGRRRARVNPAWTTILGIADGL